MLIIVTHFSVYQSARYKRKSHYDVNAILLITNEVNLFYIFIIFVSSLLRHQKRNYHGGDVLIKD